MALLYQFAGSHYCEKARWALDFKGVGYQARNLVPGFHMRTARRIATATMLPILVDDERLWGATVDHGRDTFADANCNRVFVAGFQIGGDQDSRHLRRDSSMENDRGIDVLGISQQLLTPLERPFGKG